MFIPSTCGFTLLSWGDNIEPVSHILVSKYVDEISNLHAPFFFFILSYLERLI